MTGAIRPDLLAALPEHIAGRIKAQIDGLRTCRGMVGGFDLDELKRTSFVAPAVFVSRLSVLPHPRPAAGPQRYFGISLAAFIVTRDAHGLHRDAAAGAITQALLELIPDERWGWVALGPAEAIEARVLVGQGARDAATHLSAVTWTQPCTFAPRPSSDPMPLDLYVRGEPL